MRTFRIFLVLFILGTLLAGLIGCSGDENTEEASTYTTDVQRGDLTLSISAAGNLALARTEDVAVDLFYQEATVAEVLVEEGDSVTEGQELVRLDADEWNEELATLQKALITANRNLTARETSLYEAERLVTTRESAVVEAQRLVTSREFAVRQAELDVQSANLTLYKIAEINKVHQQLKNAEFTLQFAREVLNKKYSGIQVDDIGKYEMMIAAAQQEYDDCLEDLNDLLTDINLTGYAGDEELALNIAQKQLLIEQKLMALEDAQLAVQEAESAVEDAEYNVVQAEQSVKDAQLNVEDAQQAVEEVEANLDRANGLSPVLTAPFDGFVTVVNVAGGDEVLKGTVAVQVADPDKFEADILVSETDILSVKVGTRATVMADAITGVPYPATVTHISPTATISSGVVNYTVRVELSSLDDMSSQFPAFSENRTGGNFNFGGPASGNMTGGFPFSGNMSFEMPEGFEFPSGGFGGMFGAATDTEYDLREGMSVTVNLITSSETNVLLVPYTAVTKTGGKSYVTVELSSGETEQREVTTGSTNYAMIAVTSGLNEGETVVVPEGTITSSGGMQFPMGGGFFMGGR